MTFDPPWQWGTTDNPIHVEAVGQNDEVHLLLNARQQSELKRMLNQANTGQWTLGKRDELGRVKIPTKRTLVDRAPACVLAIDRLWFLARGDQRDLGHISVTDMEFVQTRHVLDMGDPEAPPQYQPPQHDTNERPGDVATPKPAVA